MKILITGGAGFIGSHLIEKLYLEHEVTVIDNLSTGHIENIHPFIEKISFHNFDLFLGNKKKLDEIIQGTEVVFHLAALADIVPSMQYPEKYYNSNVTGTFNLLQAMVRNKIPKIIYSASSSCYGIPDKFPTDELAEERPQYPYALTKLLGEKLIFHWSNLYNFNCNSLRLFNVYGTRSRTSGTYGAMFGVFLAQKLANQSLTVVGNGEQTRDFTYVSDVADAFISVGFSNINNQIFNIGSGETVSINRIVDLLKCKSTFIPKRPGEPDCTFADINKIKSSTKWTPKISIEKGISFLLDDIDYWKDAPVWTPSSIEKETKDWFKYLGKAK
ncbi:GDP-mannose 4,6-dehydratase [Alphaproteobacteria bacterium]|nr:GDP-mannose 4,6-dehydratase [Alphaproteobacteria bacterium]